MIHKCKKGEVLLVTYYFRRCKRRSVGIVLDARDTALTIGHNFDRTLPIDITSIPAKDIIKYEKVTPKEINSPDDMAA